MFGVIKRELRRRSVIGHMKAEGHLGRCYLKGTAGDAAKATAIGHNLRLILARPRILLVPDPSRATEDAASRS